MANSVAEAVIGAVVLATAVGFVVYAGQSRGISLTSESIPIKASFRSADGINVGTDVRVAGINVGTVSALALDPTTFQANATFTVQKNLELARRFRREDLVGEPARRQLRRDHAGGVGHDAGGRRRDREYPRLGEPAEPLDALRDGKVIRLLLGIALVLAAGQAVAAQSAQASGRAVARAGWPRSSMARR